ncbi:unnamed protein product, partial [Vitis vinifera]
MLYVIPSTNFPFFFKSQNRVIRLMPRPFQFLPNNESIFHLPDQAQHTNQTIIGAQIRAKRTRIQALILHLFEEVQSSTQITPTPKCMYAYVVTLCIQVKILLCSQFFKHISELNFHGNRHSKNGKE